MTSIAGDVLGVVVALDVLVNWRSVGGILSRHPSGTPSGNVGA